jgi:hypothetical protein
MHLHMMSTTMEYMINIAYNSSSILKDTYYDIKSFMQLLSFIIFDANLFFNWFFLSICLFLEYKLALILEIFFLAPKPNHFNS